MSKQVKADLLLIMVTAFWGVSYYFTDICLADLPPMCLNAFRFIIAFVLLGLVFYKHLRNLNRITFRYSIIIGLALTGTYIFYGYGILLTSLTNASFICTLPVVFTPLIGSLFFRTRLNLRQFICILICVLGLALLTLNDDLRPAFGDIICMGVPVCYALDLLITERAVKNPDVDPLSLGICELGVVGVITLLISLFAERPHMPSTPGIWFRVLFLGVFCSGIAFVIQSVQQQYTTASHVGLIFTLEPVFASIVAFFFAQERLAPRCYAGMVIMLFSLVLMETGAPGKKQISEK